MYLANQAHRIHDARLPARNRRRHDRVAARGLASHLQTGAESTAGLAVENISLGGLFVRTASALPIGTRVALQMVRPGLKRAIRATGHVVSVITPEQARAKGVTAGMGIGLDGLDPESEQRLRALVEEMGGEIQVGAGHRNAPALVTEHEAMFFELAEARGTIEEQAARIAQMEREMNELRRELLRRNRTIADMANELAARKAA